MVEFKGSTHPALLISSYRWMPEKCRDRTGGFNTLSNVLGPNYFQLRDIFEPDVFPVFSDSKRTSPPHAYEQALLEPMQVFCIYS